MAVRATAARIRKNDMLRKRLAISTGDEAALALSAAILRISNPASAGVRASKIFFSKSGIGMSPLLILSEVALPQRLLHMVRAASWVMKALGVPRWLSQ